MGLSSWMAKIIEHVKGVDGLEIVVLSGAEAAPKELLEAVSDMKPDFVAFNGHGDSRSLYGYDNVLLVSADDDLEPFSGKIIHALACDAGAELGPELVRIGAKAFIGYIEPFQFYIEAANLFLEPAYEVVKSICSGDSVLTAYGKSQEMYKKNLAVVMATATSSQNGDALLLAASLFKDLNAQVLLGDVNAAI